ncbi:porin family protein [Hymenobacter seoulensis]
MHKVFILLLGAVLLSNVTHAQKMGIKFGVKGGANLAILDGLVNVDPEFRIAPVGGVFLRLRSDQVFAFQPEVLISGQGMRRQWSYSTNSGKQSTRLTYLAVPIMSKVYIKSIFYLEVGPQFGLLLGGNVKGESRYNDGSTQKEIAYEKDVKKDYSNDFALCGGLGVDFKNGLTIGTRLNYGISDINNNVDSQRARKLDGMGGIHNRVFQFSVGYLFGKN